MTPQTILRPILLASLQLLFTLGTPGQTFTETCPGAMPSNWHDTIDGYSVQDSQWAEQGGMVFGNWTSDFDLDYEFPLPPPRIDANRYMTKLVIEIEGEGFSFGSAALSISGVAQGQLPYSEGIKRYEFLENDLSRVIYIANGKYFVNVNLKSESAGDKYDLKRITVSYSFVGVDSKLLQLYHLSRSLQKPFMAVQETMKMIKNGSPDRNWARRTLYSASLGVALSVVTEFDVSLQILGFIFKTPYDLDTVLQNSLSELMGSGGLLHALEGVDGTTYLDAVENWSFIVLNSLSACEKASWDSINSAPDSSQINSRIETLLSDIKSFLKNANYLVGEIKRQNLIKDEVKCAHAALIVFRPLLNYSIDLKDGNTAAASDSPLFKMIELLGSFKIASDPRIEVTPHQYTVASNAGAISFSVNNTGGGILQWTASVSTGSEWLKIESGFNGSNSGVIQCSFTANPSAVSRGAIIQVKSGGAVLQELSVDQAALQIGVPIKAKNPEPKNGQTGVPVKYDFAWFDGGGAASFDIYFGKQPPGLFQRNQTENAWGTTEFDHGTIYYWRIDSRNAAGLTMGDVWWFKTVEAPPRLGVEPRALNVGFASGLTTVQLSNLGGGQLNWSATVSSGNDWLKIISDQTGVNDGFIYLSYGENSLPNSRSANLRIDTAASGSEMISLVQAGAPQIPSALKLSIASSPKGIQLTWPAAALNYDVFHAGILSHPAPWQMLGAEPVLSNGQFVLNAESRGNAGFYRLQLKGISTASLSNLVWIDPGSFIMGSPPTEAGRQTDESPQVSVAISRGFWMGKYEVTQNEFECVTAGTPLDTNNIDRYPAANVSWIDATNYCSMLNNRESAAGRLPSGYAYRLPTEAEWEYACRAGTKSRFSFGEDLEELALNNYGWYLDNSNGRTHPVGQKMANPWNLRDMHGNAWEWCQDWYGPYSGANTINPLGPSSGTERVVRGGSFGCAAWRVRSAVRFHYNPDDRGEGVTFRIVLAPY